MILWAYAAFAAPVKPDRSLKPRDQTAGGSNTGVIIAGVIFGVVVVLATVAFLVMYFRDPYNFWKRRQNKKANRLSTAIAAEVNLLKRPSISSDRESIMFSRSRSSSMQFAVVEESDETQSRRSQQIYYRQGESYVPLQQMDTVYVGVDSDSLGDKSRNDAQRLLETRANIPVVVTPPASEDRRLFEDLTEHVPKSVTQDQRNPDL
jgi:hypothetical protein